MAVTSLLADLEDTSGDVPVIPHAHSGMPQPIPKLEPPTEWERGVAKLWIGAMRDTLARVKPPAGRKDPGSEKSTTAESDFGAT